MAVVEENWQSKCSAVADRTTFIFNTELLSDVKFVVPTSSDESESKKVIPAHKFVLAISSPVFYAMFYGQMAETKESIEVPDWGCPKSRNAGNPECRNAGMPEIKTRKS